MTASPPQLNDHGDMDVAHCRLGTASGALVAMHNAVERPNLVRARRRGLCHAPQAIITIDTRLRCACSYTGYLRKTYPPLPAGVPKVGACAPLVSVVV